MSLWFEFKAAFPNQPCPARGFVKQKNRPGNRAVNCFSFLFQLRLNYAFLPFGCFACAESVLKAVIARITARTTRAMDQMVWNQVPQSAAPPPILPKLVMMVKQRAVMVATSMNTIGKKNILLLRPILPSQVQTASIATPASSWLAERSR